MRVDRTRGVQQPSKLKIAEFDSPYPLQMKVYMKNFFKNLFAKKEQWALVKTIKVSHTHATYVYHIQLFESPSGARRAEFFCDGDEYDINRKGAWLKTQDVYQMQIYRWLQGRYDPDIPKFADIAEEDLVHALKGKIG